MHHCKSEAGMGMDSLEDLLALTQANKNKKKKESPLKRHKASGRTQSAATDVLELFLYI